MQPQMPFFLGREPPPAPLTTTAQKVFRTPDIDEVGLDTYHLTFFEMLGNFSFGQYFKEGAIEYATEFIRERLQLDWDRVWVTVHAGDPELKLGPDQVAIDLWERIGMPPERIVAAAVVRELLVGRRPGAVRAGLRDLLGLGRGDRLRRAGLPARAARAASASSSSGTSSSWSTSCTRPDADAAARSRTSTPGWGLERVARVLQDVPSVYDTDGYQLIMQWIAEQSGVAYGDSPDATKAHRVLADHGRGMTFLVARRRHAVERGARLRAAPGDPPRRPARPADRACRRRSCPALADTVIEQMGDAYPELVEHRDEIHASLAAEEERFAETLERGMTLFEEAASRRRASAATTRSRSRRPTASRSS